MSETEVRYGLVCNYMTGDKYVRAGAKAYLLQMNGMAERCLFLIPSRGGRLIEKYLPLKRCSNWRAKWLPDHVMDRYAPIYTRAEAEEIAARLNRWAAESQGNAAGTFSGTSLE